MNYINKHNGTNGSNLDYHDGGNWIMTISEDNRFRKLTNKEGDIKALDINLMAGMVEVGKKLPGYNREVRAIHEISDCKFMVECFGW